MQSKEDILTQGISNSEHSYHEEKSYHRCPFCQSVNLRITHEDDDTIHFLCLECKKQDWKTKL
jgi:Zn finger protein HypA/HybF involved in hydrogenase expression